MACSVHDRRALPGVGNRAARTSSPGAPEGVQRNYGRWRDSAAAEQIAVASVRDRTCSFIRMLLTWFLTVNTLRSSVLGDLGVGAPFGQQLGDLGLAVGEASRRRPEATPVPSASTRVTSDENEPRPAATLRTASARPSASTDFTR